MILQIKLTKKQGELLKTLTQSQAKVIGYGGGFGGGKSYGSISILLAYALKFSNTRYAIFRKTLAILKQTSLLTFFDVCKKYNIEKGKHFTYNKQEMKVTFFNESEIYFKGTDSKEDPEMNGLKLELTAALMEEADESTFEAFNLIRGRIGRRNLNGQIKPFLLLTFNPSESWVKEEFYTPWKDNRLREDFAFVQALATDNPYNNTDYLDILNQLPENERQRFLMGNWDIIKDPNQLITYEMLSKHLVDQIPIEHKGEKSLGIDVARSGEDDTCFALIDEEKLINIGSVHGNDIPSSAMMGKNIIDEYQMKHEKCKIDINGIGAGVYDNLRLWHYNVTGFNSAESPSKRRDDNFEFFNKRAEAYWDLRERFLTGTLYIPKSETKLIQELVVARYEIRGRKIIIESKDDIKKRLHRSPDRADALVMANYNGRINEFVVMTV